MPLQELLPLVLAQEILEFDLHAPMSLTIKSARGKAFVLMLVFYIAVIMEIQESTELISILRFYKLLPV
jgi:hypothetical protein